VSHARRLVRDVRGAAHVEFLIAIVPVLLLCFGIVQYAMTAIAQQVVSHAAWASARAAIVILDDDPVHYGEPVGLLATDASRDSPGWERALLSALGGGAPITAGTAARRGGARLSAIRRAASRPLSVLAPGPDELAARLEGRPQLPLSLSLGGGASRIAVGLGMYNDWAAALTFPTAAASAVLHDRAIPDDAESITVRITYLHRCTVPMVAALMCESIRAAQLRDAADGPLAELARVPSPLGLSALLTAGGYHRVLRAEATLPRQRAAYAYE